MIIHIAQTAGVPGPRVSDIESPHALYPTIYSHAFPVRSRSKETWEPKKDTGAWGVEGKVRRVARSLKLLEGSWIRGL